MVNSSTRNLDPLKLVTQMALLATGVRLVDWIPTLVFLLDQGRPLAVTLLLSTPALAYLIAAGLVAFGRVRIGAKTLIAISSLDGTLMLILLALHIEDLVALYYLSALLVDVLILVTCRRLLRETSWRRSVSATERG